MLRNKTLDINVIDPQTGVNAFWLACLYGHGDIMKILAEAGADIYITNRRNINVLHLAILKNHIEIVTMLIESGFTLDEETLEGSTALHLAAQTNHNEISEIIINHLVENDYKKSVVVETISRVTSSSNLSPLGISILMNNK